MDKIMAIWQMMMSAQAAPYWMALFALSEALGMLPFFKESAVFGYAMKALAWIKKLVLKQEEAPKV